MKKTPFIDINCDMGEGMPTDIALLPFITSANIACGFHAGNGDTIRRTILAALRFNVHVGAHPSFRDRENFGRKEMHLSADKLYAIVIEQLIKLDLIARETGALLHHVKPHGALYTMAAKDASMARTIAQAVKDFDEGLVLYGLSGSHLISEAGALGLRTASEVFADRTYREDISLTPRSEAGALIKDEETCIRQARQMVHEGTVTTTTGKVVPITAETICIHGDGTHAVAFARAIHGLLTREESTR